MTPSCAAPLCVKYSQHAVTYEAKENCRRFQRATDPLPRLLRHRHERTEKIHRLRSSGNPSARTRPRSVLQETYKDCQQAIRDIADQLREAHL